jgi:hypothetical protein
MYDHLLSTAWYTVARPVFWTWVCTDTHSSIVVRVARFFLEQRWNNTQNIPKGLKFTKGAQNITNGHKIYQMDRKYTGIFEPGSLTDLRSNRYWWN